MCDRADFSELPTFAHEIRSARRLHVICPISGAQHPLPYLCPHRAKNPRRLASRLRNLRLSSLQPESLSDNHEHTRQRPLQLPSMSLVSGEKTNFQFVSLSLALPRWRRRFQRLAFASTRSPIRAEGATTRHHTIPSNSRWSAG